MQAGTSGTKISTLEKQDTKKQPKKVTFTTDKEGEKDVGVETEKDSLGTGGGDD